MNLNDFKRLIRPLQRKIQLSIGRAVLSAVNNTEGTQKVQLSLLNNETITDMARFQEYGYENFPLPEAEALALFINGCRAKGITICVHDRRYRPKDLVAGEVCSYTDEDQKTDGHRYHLKRGQITNELGKIKTATFKTSVTETTETKSVTATILHAVSTVASTLIATTSRIITTPIFTVTSASISLGTGTLRSLIDSRVVSLLNTHTHPETGGANTGQMNQTIGVGHQTTNTKAS